MMTPYGYFNERQMEVLILVIMFFILLVYFIPSCVGYVRGVRTRGWLLFCNILLGFTIVGWFACLAWAVFAETDDELEFRLMVINRLTSWMVVNPSPSSASTKKKREPTLNDEWKTLP